MFGVQGCRRGPIRVTLHGRRGGEGHGRAAPRERSLCTAPVWLNDARGTCRRLNTYLSRSLRTAGHRHLPAAGLHLRTAGHGAEPAGGARGSSRGARERSEKHRKARRDLPARTYMLERRKRTMTRDVGLEAVLRWGAGVGLRRVTRERCAPPSFPVPVGWARCQGPTAAAGGSWHLAVVRFRASRPRTSVTLFHPRHRRLRAPGRPRC